MTTPADLIHDASCRDNQHDGPEAQWPCTVLTAAVLRAAEQPTGSGTDTVDTMLRRAYPWLQEGDMDKARAAIRRELTPEPPPSVVEALSLAMSQRADDLGQNWGWDDLADAVTETLPSLGYVRIDPDDEALVSRVASEVGQAIGDHPAFTGPWIEAEFADLVRMAARAALKEVRSE